MIQLFAQFVLLAEQPLTLKFLPPSILKCPFFRCLDKSSVVNVCDICGCIMLTSLCGLHGSSSL